MCFLILVLVASALYIIWYLYPKSAPVPIQPGHLPVLGYTLQFFRAKDPWQIIKDAGAFSIENGGITKLLLPFCAIYQITDADAASTVLNQCLEKMFFYKVIDQVFGSILISAAVPIWKTSRRIFDNAFKQNVLNTYLELFNQQAVKLADSLEDKVGKGEVDLKDAIRAVTLETSWQTTVEKTEEGNVDINLMECLIKQNEIWMTRARTFYLLPNFTFNFSNLKKKQNKYMKGIETKIQTAIKKTKSNFYERRKLNTNSYEDSKTFLSNLYVILEYSATDQGFHYSDSDLKMCITNLLIASFDTTTLTLLYSLVCIGSDMRVQDKVYQEIKTVVGDNNVTKEDLPKLLYLNAVIKEVIRLFPAGPVIGRQSDKEVHLRNVTIPRGGGFVVHLWAINRRKEYWGEDADLFRPERWLDPKTLPHPATAFTSFSLGQRNCIGKTYTMNAMKVYLVHILRKYRVSGDYRKLEFTFDPLLKSIAGDLVTLSYR